MAVKNKATVTPVWEMLQITEAEWRKNPGAIIAAAKLIADGRGADISALMFGAPAASGQTPGWRDPAKSVDELLQVIGAQHPGLASAASVFFNAASATRAWFFANGIMAAPTEVAAFAQHIVDQEPRHTHGVRVAQMDAMRAAAPKP